MAILMKSGSPRQSGISLVEIPVALIVIALVVAGAVRGFGTAGKVQRNSHLTNQATSYALAKANELEFSSLSFMKGGQDSLRDPSGNLFTRAWSVGNAPRGRDIEITVRWRSGGKDESIVMGTILR